MSDDPVLAWVGPVGLALSVGTALILDLAGGRAGSPTLADLAEHGPSLRELRPGRRGVATLSVGPLSDSEFLAAIEPLLRSWPAVVIRGTAGDVPVVPYRPVLPGLLGTFGPEAAVWQVSPGAEPRRLPGPVLPRLPRRDLLAMLRGGRPLSKRWVSAWRQVWEMPWV